MITCLLCSDSTCLIVQVPDDEKKNAWNERFLGEAADLPVKMSFQTLGSKEFCTSCQDRDQGSIHLVWTRGIQVIQGCERAIRVLKREVILFCLGYHLAMFFLFQFPCDTVGSLEEILPGSSFSRKMCLGKKVSLYKQDFVSYTNLLVEAFVAFRPFGTFTYCSDLCGFV